MGLSRGAFWCSQISAVSRNGTRGTPDRLADVPPVLDLDVCRLRGVDRRQVRGDIESVQKRQSGDERGRGGRVDCLLIDRTHVRDDR